MPQYPYPIGQEIREIEYRREDFVPSKFGPEEEKYYSHEAHRCGKDAISATDVEFSQADGAGADMFSEQYRRDEIAGNDEKDLYSQHGILPEELWSNSPIGQVTYDDKAD